MTLYDVPPLTQPLCLGGPGHGTLEPFGSMAALVLGYDLKYLVNIFMNASPVFVHDSLRTQAEVLRAVQSTKYSVAFGTDNITPL